MSIQQYMSQSGMTFWRSVPVAVLLGVCEWATLLAFVRPYGIDPFERGRSPWPHLALLMCYLGLSLLHFQVVIHCLATLVLCAAYLSLMTRRSWFNSVFAGSMFCLDVELGKSLCRDGLVAYGLTKLFPGLGVLAMNLILLGLYLAWLGLLCLRFLKRRHRLPELPMTLAQGAGLLFPLFLYLAVRAFQYDQVAILDNRQWFWYDLLQYAVAACALLAMRTTEGLLASQIEVGELQRRQAMMEQRQRLYELERENLDDIDRRWHDMKHCLTGLELILNDKGGGADLAQARAYIGGLRKGIDAYGDMPHTGNPVLDAMLFQYLRECRQKDIRLIPFIDGAKAGFVSTLDMSALFGNAMDNAVEAVQPLQDPALREIRVKVGASDGLLLMRFYNRFEGARRRDRGRFATTKDTRGHGYGLASIAAIAEKYGGTATAECTDDTFTLNILMPLPGKEAA